MAPKKLYTLPRTHLILDNSERHYVLKVRDLPAEEKPREKLQQYGPGVLSTQELLAAILNTGSVKEEVLGMSNRVMREYGEQGIMDARNAKKLAEDANIPLGKATQIVAVAELGRRFFQKNNMAMPTIRTAQEVFDFVLDMRDLPKEHLRGIYLNTHYKVIHTETISIGTIDANIVHPREIFKPALEYSAAAVILVHNHPSGSTEPSGTDVEVTEQLIAAGKLLGIDLIDHVVVTKDAFKSVQAPYQQ